MPVQATRRESDIQRNPRPALRARSKGRAPPALHASEHASSARPPPLTPGRSRLVLLLGLVDPAPDADGLYSGCVLPPGPSAYLWRLSWLSLLSAAVALARGHADLCLVPLSVWATSALYWWRPDYSWRRYLDIGCVQVALWYQCYRAVQAQHALAYFSLTLAGMPFFPLGACLAASPWSSALCHGMVHILGNAANICLYCGAVPQLLL